ncbi:jg20758 [Pararge aegeria aegeria]|uniref:Jg20758 protein n=1 Tax=Pararge aegeria aegeria TaxID=348720 RepID=A0A8S4R528_9NEOP|nr:jg20758 [Pararge aegeria aegeria]
MLGTKIACIFAVTLLVLFITAENEVNAAPEPCGDMMSYYPYKKPAKSIKPKEDKEKMEKDKKKEFMKKLEKMFGKFLGMK